MMCGKHQGLQKNDQYIRSSDIRRQGPKSNKLIKVLDQAEAHGTVIGRLAGLLRGDAAPYSLGTAAKLIRQLDDLEGLIEDNYPLFAESVDP